MNILKRVGVSLGLVLTALVSVGASAAIDSSVTTAITTAGTDIATIGAAMLSLAVVAMSFKWLKASFF